MRVPVGLLALGSLQILQSSGKPFPQHFSGVSDKGGGITVTSAMWSEPEKKPYQWGYSLVKEPLQDFKAELEVTIHEPAKGFRFFGQSWSVWPDLTYGDEGFEAGILLRFREREDFPNTEGYRVQFSHKYQEVALVKFPDGGYVRSVPCEVGVGSPMKVGITMVGNTIVVRVGGKEKIHYHDQILPLLSPGNLGFGASSQARVEYAGLKVREMGAVKADFDSGWLVKHKPDFRIREWLGGRPWVFDGDEPVMLLPVPKARHINNVKLRPGYLPLLSWNSHWGVENQGAYKEAENENSEIRTEGGGDSLRITWKGEHVKKRFGTSTAMDIGWDQGRQVYTYDIDSSLEVRIGEPFEFRYGYDFEHHTPLDPFRWEYLLIQPRSGDMTYRPLSPFDPGPLQDLAIDSGKRVWHGRKSGVYEISPAVEYRIDPSWHLKKDHRGNPFTRQLNTAVCAAFYDTGDSFPRELAQPGSQIRVRYRYTGYPAEETRELFKKSVVQDNPRIDPGHHFIFARDQWPNIQFNYALPMDKPWWGGRPFLSGHNARPSYDWIPAPDGSHSIGLDPNSYAVSNVGPVPIEPGKYLVVARVKSANTHGPGGRLEVLALKNGNQHGNNYVRSNKDNILAENVFFFGNGSFGWKEYSFVVDIPKEAEGIALGLGNEGTGQVQVSKVSFRKMSPGEKPVLFLGDKPKVESVPGAIWDFRMEEQEGFYAYNHGSEERYRSLELANVDWVIDEGRKGIRFSENPESRADFPNLGFLDSQLRNSPYGNYHAQKHGAFAFAGYHGGGKKYNGLTLAAWIKPDSEMGKSHHKGKGDIIGFGARRFILGLHNQTAPYKLAARLNVNDRFETSAPLVQAGKWAHVAMTAKTQGDHVEVKLYLDGEEVGGGMTGDFQLDAPTPPSVILGGELFYLHDAYYRGLVGRTIILDQILAPKEIKKLAME